MIDSEWDGLLIVKLRGGALEARPDILSGQYRLLVCIGEH
jgi:hypothetical protein